MDEVTGFTMNDKQYKYDSYIEKPKKVKKVKVKVKKVDKSIVESKIDKGTFNLERTKSRYKIRCNAELVKDTETEVIFESDTVIYKLKKV